MNSTAPESQGTSPAGPVWMVGHRNGAIRAATEMGLESVTLPPAATGELERLAGPIAVVATTEAGVEQAAALRERYALPGISVATARICTNKRLMKQAAREAGIPTARWMSVSTETSAEDVMDVCGLPVVVKAPVSSGSRSIRTCYTLAQLRDTLSPGQLCESLIRGVEMSVESLLADGQCLFRNYTRYYRPGWASIVPADLDDEQRRQIDAVVDRVHVAFGCHSGMTHAELFLTDDGVVLGEIAARPPGGRLMELIERSYEFDPWQAVLQVALGWPVETQPVPRRYAGVWLMHPGAGVIGRTSGQSAARAVPGVTQVSLRTRRGRVLTAREGTGQSVGEIYAEGSTMKACEESLQAAHAAIDIELED